MRVKIKNISQKHSRQGLQKRFSVRALMSCVAFAVVLIGAAKPMLSYAITTQEAVKDAWNTQLPDINGIVQDAVRDPKPVLGSVGNASTEGLDKETGAYDGGFGEVFGPAEDNVIACRDKTDPTCRAIQIMGEPFDERPPISEDVLVGRDEIVNQPVELPDNGTTGCKPIVVGTKPIVTTETCRAGGWFEDMACQVGVTEIDRVTAHHFSCGTGTERTEKKSCLSEVTGSTSTTDYTQRCFFGAESLTGSGVIKTITNATAKATFPATCLAPQGSTQEVICNEIFVQTSHSPCTPGTTQYLTIKGGESLQYDLCPLGDELKLAYKCGYAHYLNFELNGYPAIQLRVGNVGGPLTNKHDSRCHATIRYIREECSGETCVGTIDARVLLTTHLQGAISGKITYPNDNEDTQGHWEDHCADFRP
ncbi:MAG: hypothetical protein KHX35_07685 [Sutterella wadsworthensis]|nr:hypothetical protein [Sutterella wadsworthensis]